MGHWCVTLCTYYNELLCLYFLYSPSVRLLYLIVSFSIASIFTVQTLGTAPWGVDGQAYISMDPQVPASMSSCVMLPVARMWPWVVDGVEQSEKCENAVSL